MFYHISTIKNSFYIQQIPVIKNVRTPRKLMKPTVFVSRSRKLFHVSRIYIKFFNFVTYFPHIGMPYIARYTISTICNNRSKWVTFILKTLFSTAFSNIFSLQLITQMTYDKETHDEDMIKKTF